MTIDSPVAYGILLIRILVRNNGTDLAAVRQIIDSCSLTKGEIRNSTVQPLSLATFANISNMSLPVGILELTARTLNASQPFSVTNPMAIVRELKEAGVYGGSYKESASVNLSTTAIDALTAVTTVANTSFQTLNNGWTRFTLQGLYGSNYVARAQIAYSGYLALVSSETIYPSYQMGNFSLASDEAYLYTFSSKPPLGQSGFWSLTCYNAAGFLVANPIDVYAVGDRSNLTYSDGSLVYGNGSSSNESFQVLIQSGAVPPPANWTSK
jgi:hypothetical protein